MSEIYTQEVSYGYRQMLLDTRPVWRTLSECTAKLVLRRSPVIMAVLWIPLSSWDWIYD